MFKQHIFILEKCNNILGLSWSYGSWIYNYLCNQCLSPLMLRVWISLMAILMYSIQHYVIKFVSDLRLLVLLITAERTVRNINSIVIE